MGTSLRHQNIQRTVVEKSRVTLAFKKEKIVKVAVHSYLESIYKAEIEYDG